MHQDQEGISFVFVLNVSVTAIKPDPVAFKCPGSVYGDVQCTLSVLEERAVENLCIYNIRCMYSVGNNTFICYKNSIMVQYLASKQSERDTYRSK